MLSMSSGAGNTADAADYTITPNPVRVSKHDGKSPWTQDVMVEVEAMTDEDVGMEMLVLDSEVMGTVTANGTMPDDYAAVATLTIEDKTMKQVEPKPAAEAQAAVDMARDAAVGAEGLNPVSRSWS